ncbi:hypothetical protein J3B02_001602 [Coemansia erecta]|nr:hypothetical protein J3B02_001602 [Coemansia erecta]
MAAAAEHAAELELAEVTASLFSKRTSTRSSVKSMPHQRSSSGSDTTDVDAEYPAATPLTVRTDSPLTGPTRRASIENVVKANHQLQPSLGLAAMATDTKPVATYATSENRDVDAVDRQIPSQIELTLF